MQPFINDGSKNSSQFLASSQRTTRQFRYFSMQTVEFAVPSDSTDELSTVEYLGGGSFGNVIKITNFICADGRRTVVAIKKLYEPFRDEKTALRVHREIRLLQMMVHENIVRLLDLYTPDSSLSTLSIVYIVTEYAGNSLYEILKRERETGLRILTPEHHKFIIYQLLRALKYIHSANVMHRDLKPGNLALTDECDLSVLDFGLARSLNADDTVLSAYVITRWYRSPEVMYWKICSYDTQAMAQYRLIAELCGSPDPELLAKLASNEAILNVITKLGIYSRKSFPEYFPKTFSKHLVDFLDRILVLDPEKRMTVTDALSHPYLEEYSMPEDEPVADGPFILDEGSNGRTIAEWKALIWKELLNFDQRKKNMFLCNFLKPCKKVGKNQLPKSRNKYCIIDENFTPNIRISKIKVVEEKKREGGKKKQIIITERSGRDEKEKGRRKKDEDELLNWNKR
uniref:Mitogen-activated protein kinase n=1 Tax=Wuchereria bancrofti TaxID=6293 RepID=A0A1I8E9J7_WUCBA